MLTLLIGIFALTASIALIISWAQLTSFFIQWFGSGAIDGFSTEFWQVVHFWAWVAMLTIMVFAIFLLKLAAVIINRIVLTFALIGNSGMSSILRRSYIVGITLMFFWLIFSIYAASELFNWFALYPELTDWFHEGNWVAWLALGLAVFSITNRFKLSDKG